MNFKNSLKVGILGGGQLGKMLIQSALNFDLDIWVLENDDECPCKPIAHNFLKGDLNDFETVYNFGKNVEILTIEIENVNIEALKLLEKEGLRVFPQPHVLQNIKNKVSQKAFFIENDLPTVEYKVVSGQEDLLNYLDFLPAVNKIGVGGYDGKGVQVLKTESDIKKAFDAEGILEKLVNFEKELAVVVARSVSGEVKAFPVVEMVFHPEANLVEYLFSPAHISEELTQKATEIAQKTAEKYGIVGLLAVEMFLTNTGEILINEVAPRPHNSGHHTQKANFTSQFEQHLRAILDLPLGNTDAIMPAAMVNLLGEDGYSGVAVYEGMDKVLSKDLIFPFLYGKKITKPFRKMGHVSILDKNFESLKEKVNFVKENLKVIA
jgi:5-(carboxyamino)imidazole ribonucleotide synthase